MGGLVEACEREGLIINTKKTVIMLITKKNNNIALNICRRNMKQVENYSYLGSLISGDGSSNQEIEAKKRIEIEKKNQLLVE